MGFSLVGNSGDSSSSTNIYETNYSASLNPQFDQQGSGTGAVAVDLAPLLQGSTLSNYDPNFADFFAPINITATGDNYGDSALAALQNLTQSQVGTSEAAGTSSTSSLASLFSGNTIYYVLGAIVLLFLSHHHKA